jgi:hypothetical protein
MHQRKIHDAPNIKSIKPREISGITTIVLQATNMLLMNDLPFPSALYEQASNARNFSALIACHVLPST